MFTIRKTGKLTVFWVVFVEQVMSLVLFIILNPEAVPVFSFFLLLKSKSLNISLASCVNQILHSNMLTISRYRLRRRERQTERESNRAGETQREMQI